MIRQKRLVDHYNTIINGRRCEQSTRIREIQKVMTSLINKVEKNVSKEQKHIQDECTSFINHLICSVEKYNSCVLYCKCFTPYFPQRHYIQCDVCDFWYHTSCVGIDSRKSSLIIEFVCPWCEKKTGKVTQYETPGVSFSCFPLLDSRMVCPPNVLPLNVLSVTATSLVPATCPAIFMLVIR